ncbi:uncharacterized protein ASCRUDRAFT_73685 [Ascoidea rubescens DSM 1968]|uniref:Uncharacterized protein n=1 Tax=Ascoidea rubescens DSM 1968 TaxID=1344418 RepID=A0A1D2VQQ8_9ASCO|nr:hypothetical protein ASCRUDRAFT_73685 [Ascoidea rubescens DSM 1968]ODV63953.1 hypothetical protein ASCRUDRAFT_73685 [Ascoidea rubescens DSM 1968]
MTITSIPSNGEATIRSISYSSSTVVTVPSSPSSSLTSFPSHTSDTLSNNNNNNNNGSSISFGKKIKQALSRTNSFSRPKLYRHESSSNNLFKQFSSSNLVNHSHGNSHHHGINLNLSIDPLSANYGNLPAVPLIPLTPISPRQRANSTPIDNLFNNSNNLISNNNNNASNNNNNNNNTYISSGNKLNYTGNINYSTTANNNNINSQDNLQSLRKTRNNTVGTPAELYSNFHTNSSNGNSQLNNNTFFIEDCNYFDQINRNSKTYDNCEEDDEEIIYADNMASSILERIDNMNAFDEQTIWKI